MWEIIQISSSFLYKGNNKNDLPPFSGHDKDDDVLSRKTVIRIDNEDDEELDDIDDIHSPLEVTTINSTLISNAFHNTL